LTSFGFQAIIENESNPILTEVTMLSTMFLAVFLLGSIHSSHERSIPASGRDEAHDNNTLWTVLDEAFGNIGSSGGASSSMEFPGGTGDNHLYRGCDWIGFTTPQGETLVVANGLC
jgi:hypothetical protein